MLFILFRDPSFRLVWSNVDCYGISVLRLPRGRRGEAVGSPLDVMDVDFGYSLLVSSYNNQTFGGGGRIYCSDCFKEAEEL